tara:strand:+ start:111576 stop:112460 length:885 start_codon:yes stop_codon:yes gene_type:complete
MNPKRPKDTHPDIRNERPGRIPESLINAAIDGELNDDMQREIAHALQYDTDRKQELIDTADAINALQMPISMPDFSQGVLDRADRHRRYIPATWRRYVRAGRIGIAATLLVSLMVVAGLQNLYPRLTTIAAHPTPVKDIENAVSQDANHFAAIIKEETESIQARVTSFDLLPGVPGRTDHRLEFNPTELRLASTPSDHLSGQLGSAHTNIRSRETFDSTRFPSAYFASNDPSFAREYAPFRLVSTGLNRGFRSYPSGFSDQPRIISVAYTQTTHSSKTGRLKRVTIEIDVPDLP